MVDITVYVNFIDSNLACKHILVNLISPIDFLAAAFWKYLIVSLLPCWKARLFLFETVPHL